MDLQKVRVQEDNRIEEEEADRKDYEKMRWTNLWTIIMIERREAASAVKSLNTIITVNIR